MKRNFKGILKESVKGVVSFNVRLKPYTTFKIGGVPRVWVEPASLDDLRQALKIFQESKIEPFLIGSGSNLLIHDGKINKAVIKLSAPCFKKVVYSGRSVTCGSGHNLSRLIKGCIEKGLSGLEGLAGIPGTVGGAVIGNAGAGTDIGDIIEWVKVMDYKGTKVSLLKKEKLKFKYRNSGLYRYIILEVKFALKKRSPKIIKKTFDELLQKKMMSQDYRLPNAGCIFKNPEDPGLTTGQILEKCGLKGLRIGDAEVSTKHANFIVNKGKARFRDVMSLIKMEQDIVRKHFGICLKSEIKIIK